MSLPHTLRLFGAILLLVGVIQVAPVRSAQPQGIPSLSVPDHPVYQALRSLDPPPRAYAQLSLHAYGADEVALPAGWETILTSDVPGLSRDGYFGVAYVRRSTGQMIIAHRGTECDSIFTQVCLKDLTQGDLEIALRKIPEQYQYAEQFVARAYQQYRQDVQDIDPAGKTTQTGHSLGAILAEMAAHQYGNDLAVTFDSPGSRAIVTRLGQTPDDTKVISFQASPHFINRANEHIGRIYRLYPPHEIAIVDLLSALQQHSMLGLFQQFDPLTGLPFVVSDQGVGGWEGLSLLPVEFVVEADIDLSPHHWWGVQYGPFPDLVKKVFISAPDHGSGVQNPRPGGVTIVGGHGANQLWGDTTGNDVLIPMGGVDEVLSYGGDDEIQLAVGGVPDGEADTIRIITALGTTGARRLRQPDSADLLIWDGLPLQGLASPLPQGGYRLVSTVGATTRTFSLRLAAGTLLIEPATDSQNSVTVYGFYEGALGIFLDPASVTACATGVTIRGDVKGPETHRGTCGPDEIRADGDRTVFPAKNADDQIMAGPGADTVFASDLYVFLTSEVNTVDLGPGDDTVAGGNGKDTIHGGLGADVMNGCLLYPDAELDIGFGDEGDDQLACFEYAYGGAGADYIAAKGAGGAEKRLFASGGPGPDYLIGMFDDRESFVPPPLVIELNGDGDDDILHAYKQPFVSYRDTSTFYMRGGDGQNTYVIDPHLLQDGATIVIEPGPGDFAAEGPSIWLSETFLFDPAKPSTGSMPIAQAPGYVKAYRVADSTLVLTPPAPQGVAASTPVGQIVIRNFHNGLFGITGLANASSVPTGPWAPATRSLVFLPLLRTR